MAIEKTFIMIKPDAVRDRKIGEIVARIERSGLVIERMEMTTLERATVEEHYAHLADKPFFGGLCDFMTSGPVVKMVVSGLSAVAKMRTLMGATNPLDAAPPMGQDMGSCSTRRARSDNRSSTYRQSFASTRCACVRRAARNRRGLRLSRLQQRRSQSHPTTRIR